MSFSDPYTQEYLRPRTTDLFPLQASYDLIHRSRSPAPQPNLAIYTGPGPGSHRLPSSPRLVQYTYGEPLVQHADMPVGAPTLPQVHAARVYDHHPPPSAPAPDRLPLVECLAVEPSHGAPGSHIKLVINIHPAPNAPIRSFRATFGAVDATTRVTFENRGSNVEHVELLATAPVVLGPARTGRVVLVVQAIGMNDQVLAQADAGMFEYIDRAVFNLCARPQLMPKLAVAAMQFHQPATSSPVSQHRQLQSPLTPTNPRKRFGDALQNDRSAPGRPPPMDFSATVSPRVIQSPHMAHSPAHSSYPPSPSYPYPPSQGNSPDKAYFSSMDVSPQPKPGTLRINVDLANEFDSSDGMHSAASSPHRLSALSHLGTADFQPALLRTSQINERPLAARAPNGKPVANKAILAIEGDLNSMAVGWSTEEWTAKRRLVQFFRKQEGNVITATFRPLRPDEYRQNTIVVSCIFREEKNECFVTSVDAIYLLEAMIGQRFSVEEKNRIRRNLEGFKPITVTKAKPDSEPFFKLIMGFPNPKPRNIEKDVKVFPWKILGHALKKIMGKYSATYVADLEATPSTPSAPHSPAESRSLSRKSSRDEIMLEAPRLASAPSITSHSSFQSPLSMYSTSLAPPGPDTLSHAPNPVVFPSSNPYQSPYTQRPRHLSQHHRSYSDMSGLNLKSIAANQLAAQNNHGQHLGPSFSHIHGQGHQRSRTTLDGSQPFSFPQPTHPLAASVPISPGTLGGSTNQEIPFFRSNSSGHIPSLDMGTYDALPVPPPERRASSAGAIDEHFEPIGCGEGDDALVPGTTGRKWTL